MSKQSPVLMNEEAMSKFLSDSAADFDRYKSDRDSIGFDEKMRVADGMWRCMKNRGLADAERASSSKAPDTRANIGSGRFFRLVNQKASLGHAVSSSVEVPFKYKTTANPEVWGSAQEAASQAAVMNALAKYAWKNGKCAQKMYQFWFQAHKYCNIPIQVVMNEEIRRVAVKDPESKKVTWKEKTVNVFPTFKVLHWSMLYADIYTPTIEDQNCVVVLSIVPWMDIQTGVKKKWYDKEQVEKIKESRQTYRWDGTEGALARQDQVENAGDSGYSPGESDLYLKWDIYRYAPIKGADYDEEADYELYWATTIGNTIQTSIPVRMVTDFDPDGEIPVKMVKVVPDDSDMLYSMSWSEAIRAMYSIECTLWEQTIDNISGVNNPFLLYDPSKMQQLPDDFLFKPGAKLACDDINGTINEFVPRDTTAQTAQLIQLVQNEEGVSASVNSNMMGEAYGGRTPASESIAINRFSQQPNLGETSYILHQLMEFVGRKYKSYYQAFSDPKMVKMIADEELDYPIEGEGDGFNIYGDFDVEIDVMDEFVEDFVQAGQELQLLQSVAGNPALMQSKDHSINIGKWISSIMRRMKVHNVDSIVLPGKGLDAHLRQRDENRQMIQTGEYINPQDGEDHEAHASEVQAEILRWQPIANARINPQDGELIAEQGRAADILNLLLVPHLKAHQAFMDQQGMQAQMGEQGAPQMTPGQEAGNIPAGMLGGMNVQ